MQIKHKPKSRRRKAYEASKLGALGAASACRRIDPATGEVLATVSKQAGRRHKANAAGDK